jgi:hypothetical protein
MLLLLLQAPNELHVTHNHLPAAVFANGGGLMVTYGRYCCRMQDAPA